MLPFQLFWWFESFHFGGFVSAFQVLVHAFDKQSPNLEEVIPVQVTQFYKLYGIFNTENMRSVGEFRGLILAYWLTT